MRTLASAFSNKMEAEAAMRQLEGIGIPRDRIILRDVTSDDVAAGSTDAVFISVKVPTDQVRSVSAILDAHRPADSAPSHPLTRPAEEPVVVAEPPHRPLPPREPSAATFGTTAEVQDGRKQLSPRDQGKLGKLLALYGLALVAAFIIGAWLGLAS